MKYDEDDDHSYKKNLRRDNLHNRKRKSKKADFASNETIQQKKNFKTKKRQIEDDDSMNEWENWKDNY